MEIRSPLMRVRTLLSSSTEFMDSIHSVSTGASNTSHFSSGFSSVGREGVCGGDESIGTSRGYLLHTHTCTGHPHDTGEHAIRPLIGAKVKLSIELSQGQGLGVDGVVLRRGEGGVS